MGFFDFLNDANKLSWIQVIVLSLFPLGQLFARIVYFKGSLDKWWLMFPLLLFPPFSLIPLIMMKFGFVANGKGSDPVDKIMLLPIIAKFIIPFILPYMIDDEDHALLFSIVSFTLQFLTILVANLTRRYYTCNNTITTDSIGKAGIDSTIAFGMGELVPFVIGFIPVIGLAYSIIEMIPYIGDFVHQIFWSLGFAGTYVIINMFNQDDINKFCSTPFTGNIQDKIPFFISLIILIGINVFNSISVF